MDRTLNSLKELLYQELQDLHTMELQIVDGLEEMIENAPASRLEETLRLHLEETRQQVKKMAQLCSDLDVDDEEYEVMAISDIQQEGEDIVEQEGEDLIKAAALICVAQKIEHYEIAAYGSAAAHAKALGMTDVFTVLEDILQEEKESDDKLTELAKSINEEALTLSETDKE